MRPYEPLVYTWPDGSTVHLLGTSSFCVRCPDEESVVIHMEAVGLCSLSCSMAFTPPSLQRKLSGFLFDLLGFLRQDVENVSPVYNDMNAFGDGSLWPAPYPWFVSDLVWESICRVKKFEPMNTPDFSVHLVAMKNLHGRIGRYECNLSDLGSAPSLLFSGHGYAPEDAITDALGKALILPESKKDAWEEENLVRGQFVLPTPEEVEVYRCLGEPLPWCWPEDDRKKWLEERGVWPS